MKPTNFWVPLSPGPEHTRNVQPLLLLLNVRGGDIIQPFCCDKIQAKEGESTIKVVLSVSGNLATLSPCQKELLHEKQIFSKGQKDPHTALPRDVKQAPVYT